uniref:DNA methylase N-4/N-6 domain-containing protein n=1 Tax=Alexandrium monilatum TaxID=311494 RepID=A0A7S4R9U0_9DINO
MSCAGAAPGDPWRGAVLPGSQYLAGGVVGCAIGLVLPAVLRRLGRGGGRCAKARQANDRCPGGAAAADRAKRRPRRYAKRGVLLAGRGDAASAQQPGHSREVLCRDAVAWLEAMPTGGPMAGYLGGLPANSCIVTGVPDVHEVDPEHQMGIAGWKEWFMKVVVLLLSRLPEGSVAVLMQTDVKVPREGPRQRAGTGGSGAEGCYWEWVDKAHLALQAAAQVPETRLLWHKIILPDDRSPDAQGGGRSSSVAGYSHLLCFTRGGEAEALELAAFPDVARKGLATWVSGAGARVVEHVCRYVRERGCSVVVDPFCGEGAVLAIANCLGLSALGVELCAKRARAAQALDGQRLLEEDREERAAQHAAGAEEV